MIVNLARLSMELFIPALRTILLAVSFPFAPCHAAATSELIADRAAMERVYHDHRTGTKPPFEQAMPPAPGESLSREMWATALAVAWLESMARALEDEWGMLAAKARRWLDANVSGRRFLDAARKLLQ